MKKTLAIIITIGVIASLFAGCGNTGSTEPKSLAVVIRQTECFTQLSFNKESDVFKSNENVCQTIFDEVSDSAYSYGSITGITVESRPQISAETSLDKPDALIDNAKRRQLAKKAAKCFFEEWEENGQATSTEVDTLNAIALAGKAVKGDIEASDKHIVVCDSGLSTSGYVNFAVKNLFESDTETIVNMLETKNVIPDLSGISLVWYGLGSVAGTQAQIPAEYEHKLFDIWGAILEKTGADFNLVTTPLKEVDPADGLPHVTPVRMPAADIGDLDEGYWAISSVNFKPNSAAIVDPSAVINSLSDVVDAMDRHPSLHITIAGSCASVGDGTQLSLDRANAIKELICSTGVDRSRIETKGLGRTEWSLRVDDLDEKGALIEKNAEKNRTVYICNSNSELAREIKSLAT